jgi:hypothetical protein
MTTMQSVTAVGVFADWQHAQQAVDDLGRAGFRADQIGMVARGGEEWREGAPGLGEDSKWEEGAIGGAITGAGIGSLWALGIAGGILPVIGPVVAGGVLTSVLSSAAGGAAIGGVVGALIGLGVPKEEAHYYERELKAGRSLVTVKTEGLYEEAVDILRRRGGYDDAVTAEAMPANVGSDVYPSGSTPFRST